MKPLRSMTALILLLILLAGYGIGTAALISASINNGVDAVMTTISALIRGDMTDYMPFVRTAIGYFVQAAVRDGASPLPYFEDDLSFIYTYRGDLESDIASHNVILYGHSEQNTSAPSSEAYPYGIFWNDGKLTFLTGVGTGTDIDSAGYFFKSCCYQIDIESWLSSEVGEKSVGILIAETPMNLSASHSSLYRIYNEFRLLRLLVLAIVIGVLVVLFLFIYVFANRKSISYAAEKIAEIQRPIFLEVKLVIRFFTILFAILLLHEGFYGYPLLFVAAGLLLLLAFFLLFSDLCRNRSHVFTNNLPRFVICAVRKLLALKPFGRAELIIYILFAALEGLLGISAWIALCNSIFNGDAALIFFLFTALMMVVVAVAFGIYLYGKNREIECLLARIDHMKKGEAAPPCPLPENSRLLPSMEALDNIYAHVKSATEQSLKSERMKLELITNVSHDLKTPLTSIVSYVDLLSKEENLSPAARDYIHVLENKSERLKQLIGDLFDLSKAASSDIAYHPEPLDLVRLVNQVLAELSDKIDESDLRFICRFPAEPQIITSDGALLRRVIENLTVNALKYAMPQSRVYIDILQEAESVRYMIKNISREELCCTPEELIARFVRGDNSRSTDGSGLGLSIAQSYTEVCGGLFDLTLDGDLFKVTLTFTKSENSPSQRPPLSDDPTQ